MSRSNADKRQLELSGFEVFDRRAAPNTDTPFVTLQARGLISLNRAAYQALGNVETVELLYSPTERIIALRPSDPTSPRSYPLRQQSRSGTYLIAGKAFTTYYKINTDTAKRYKAEARDGVLLVDLKQPGSDATGARTRRTPKPTEPSIGESSTGE